MTGTGWRGDYLTLHALIRRQRKALGLTQAQAGAVIGRGEKTYREIETGRRGIDAEALFRLCAALGIRLVAAVEPQNQSDMTGLGSAGDGP